MCNNRYLVFILLNYSFSYEDLQNKGISFEADQLKLELEKLNGKFPGILSYTEKDIQETGEYLKEIKDIQESYTKLNKDAL